MQALPKGDNFMLISSKGRYTLYVLVDLAKNGQNRYIPLKEIAERQNISKKYMEGILKTLVDRNLLEGVKGKGGGYKLTKEPKDYHSVKFSGLRKATLRLFPALQKLTNIAIIWNRVPHIPSGNSLTI